MNIDLPFVKYRIALKCSSCDDMIYIETKDVQDILDDLDYKMCMCNTFVPGIDFLIPVGLTRIDRSEEKTILMKDGELLEGDKNEN